MGVPKSGRFGAVTTGSGQSVHPQQGAAQQNGSTPHDKASQICPVIFMKNILFGSLAFALLSPAAQADSAKAQPTPYAISVRGDLTPVAHSEFRYPYLAARRGLDGSCDVAFAIDPQGHTSSVSVMSCSSEAFQVPAKSIVEGMKYRPTGAQVQSATVTIRWDIKPGQDAKLD